MPVFKRFALAIGAFILSLAQLQALALDPAEMRGLRFIGASQLILDFSAVKGGTEDRTIAHFDLSGLSGPVTGATLNLSMQNQDAMLPSTLDLYSFAGDGAVSLDE